MGQVQGVLDEIVDGQTAVILIETTKQTFHLPISQLPEGSQEGIWYDISVESDQVLKLTINKEKTKEQEEAISNRLNRLRKNSKGSKFKKN
ncbi:DUF3006 domain-containing protein [Alkalibacillus haloalkaliphilus]|uniref:DUF3006 domain-containing protein n=1 Tax=Alkalibacillus haloalkaliphilus TaxID=94136 RepID=UPI0029354501|nr:DUF3006 domain-containing protein [Alkalibacillus haloalkaliphilus]MDV2581992.1 DUF3006 domain-containing protein [Alkalibacillus haloalkaliphilus]